MSLAVGFSGGLDSTVLLHVARRATDALEAQPPVAVHVHHGLQEAADRWAAHCGDVARSLGVDFELRRVQVDRSGGRGVEAAARDARMAAFAGTDADAVLLAHHRDDQVETVLFNALRGAGLAGLSGMSAARSLPDGRPLLRPFLDRPGAELRDYALAQGLFWIEDPSNRDTTLRRNLLRQSVLPLVEGGMPQARAALARLAGHASEAQMLADDLADLDAAANIDDRGLRCSALAELPAHRARNLLRRQLSLAGLRMPDAARLDEMLRQLTGDGRPAIQHDGHLVMRRQGRLLIRPA